MNTLKNRIAIVTGGAKGIGLGIVKVLAAEGATVLIADPDIQEANRIAEQLNSQNQDVRIFETDVSRRDQTEAMANAALKQWGRIDILCANAGVFPSMPLESISDTDWDAVQNINVKGVLHSVQACLPAMRQQQYGRIVLTSSITGPITGYLGWTHYGASKSAILGFMRTAAIEVARQGITINAVLPGNILTEGLSDLAPTYLQSMAARIPTGQLGKPADVGWAVRFLASDEAAFINGRTLVVDGGQTLPESFASFETL